MYIRYYSSSKPDNVNILESTPTKSVLIIFLFSISFSLTAQDDIKLSDLRITPSVNDTTCYMDSCEVSFKLINVGNTTIDSLGFRYDICQAPHSIEDYFDTLFPGDTVIFTFKTKYQSPLGNYCISVFAYLQNDSTDIRLDTNLIGVNCSSGIQITDTKYDSKIKVFPNPAVTNITISFESKTSESALIITNSLGQEIENIKIAENQSQISLDIGKYPTGTYYLRLENPGEIPSIGKFIKE